MNIKKVRTYSKTTKEAARLLGLEIQLARKQRKMSESDLSKTLANACETHVDWVHIEPRTIASALREAYTRKTGKPWPFDGRGRKKGN